MKARVPHLDRGTQASYWILKLSDAIEVGDPLMTGAARDHLRCLGFDVRPRHVRRGRPTRHVKAVPAVV